MLTYNRVLEVLDYNPETGRFLRKIRTSNAIQLSDEPGCLSNGYRVIRVDNRLYRASRLAWLVMTGEWPSGQIDHRNLIRDDNRFENLRLASPAQNSANVGTRRHNKSRIKGVQANHNKWRARITVNGCKLDLGTYDTKELAHQEYIKAAKHYFGEFARSS